jgi:hypothetical protein
MWYVIGGIVAVVLVFIGWRWTSVGRGARQRDERILKLIDPIGHKLESGEAITPEDIRQVARHPETRFMLIGALREMKHPELIPEEYASPVCQAESALAYWLMHPNELQDAPERIEHVEEVIREIDGANATFHVFRYKMAQGHWAEKGEWLLGLAVPMKDSSPPYSFLPGAFSRAGDSEGKVTPAELVDWYINMLKQ